MNGLIVVACWIVGGILAGLVLYRGMHVGWFTIRRKPVVRIDRDWAVSREREERLKAAAIWKGYRREK